MTINVAQAQRLLVALGYDIPVDGIWGPMSQGAMDTACKEHGAAAPFTQQAASVSAKNGIYGSKYFTRDEFRCTCGRCGGFPVEPTKGLVAGCDKLREAAGVPLLIVDAGGSGVRCKTHNAEVKGAANSNHLYGKAADLHPTGGVTAKQLYDLANKQLGNTGELGLYSWGIHFAPDGSYSRFNG